MTPFVEEMLVFGGFFWFQCFPAKIEIWWWFVDWQWVWVANASLMAATELRTCLNNDLPPYLSTRTYPSIHVSLKRQTHFVRPDLPPRRCPVRQNWRRSASDMAGSLLDTTRLCWRKIADIPSRQLTYPTLGKGKSSSKSPWGGYVCYQEGIQKGASKHYIFKY